jgi:hypothetical protein
MINIDELYKKKRQRVETRLKIYDIVLQKCHNKIKYSSNNHIDQEYTYFNVPSILLGYPLFNKNECSKYIISQLLKNGFIVKYIGDGLIFICWKKSLSDTIPKQKKIKFNLEKNQYIQPSSTKVISNNNKNNYKNKKVFRSITDIPINYKKPNTSYFS